MLISHREEEFYLYTLHDPTISSKGNASNTIPFPTLCPIVDRHTRFIIFSFSSSNAERQVQDIPLYPLLHWARVWRPQHCPPNPLVQGGQGWGQPQEAGQDRGGAEEGRGGGGAQVCDGDQQGPGQVPGGTCTEGHQVGWKCDQLEGGKGERTFDLLPLSA